MKNIVKETIDKVMRDKNIGVTDARIWVAKDTGLSVTTIQNAEKDGGSFKTRSLVRQLWKSLNKFTEVTKETEPPAAISDSLFEFKVACIESEIAALQIKVEQKKLDLAELKKSFYNQPPVEPEKPQKPVIVEDFMEVETRRSRTNWQKLLKGMAPGDEKTYHRQDGRSGLNQIKAHIVRAANNLGIADNFRITVIEKTNSIEIKRVW